MFQRKPVEKYVHKSSTMGLKLFLNVVRFAVAMASLGRSDFGPKAGQHVAFESDLAEDSAKSWTDKPLNRNGDGVIFAVFGDRTGLHYPGKLAQAVEKINLTHPDFVVSVGDHIEGYTRDTKMLEQEWTEFDTLIGALDSRFFEIPGNHDYSNYMMGQYYRNRHRKDYYYFLFKDILFLCLNTQDPPHEQPEDKEKQMAIGCSRWLSW